MNNLDRYSVARLCVNYLRGDLKRKFVLMQMDSTFE